MSHLRFNHVFLALMLLFAACAFVLPLRMTDPLRAQLQNVFAPVSRPVGALASWVHGRFARAKHADPRDAAEIARENERLRNSLVSLETQLKNLQAINADRQLLGEVLPLCTPVPVVGGDAGSRDSISIQSIENMKNGMFALYSGGMVGVVGRVGVSGGAQVRLITDSGFRVTGAFGRFETSEDGKPAFRTLSTPPPLVEGAGRGTMMVRRLDFESIRDLRIGDWVIVEDSDWPANLQGQGLGRIVRIDRSGSSPLFAEILIKPATNLMQLREVMVMNRTTPVHSARTE